MQILIRTAEEQDVVPITALSGELGYKNNHEDIQNRLKLLLSNADHCVFVALYDDKIVGWIHGFFTVKIESDFFVEIGSLVVKNNFRGNGIGKNLYCINLYTVDISTSNKQINCLTSPLPYKTPVVLSVV